MNTKVFLFVYSKLLYLNKLWRSLGLDFLFGILDLAVCTCFLLPDYLPQRDREDFKWS